jgi:tRNA1Val (adenine37-N6)-methyltransferase
MGRNSYFQFKQFRITQENAAFKVGTDAVLLGSWVHVPPAGKILDVGTGTGIIALMMAQRSQAAVTGIEIEHQAATEAALNAQGTPWSERIAIRQVSFQEFVKDATERFDLIISNPPFFSNSRKSRCDRMAMARHNHLLPPDEFVNGSAGLLEPNGRLAVILPVLSSSDFRRFAEAAGLYLLRLAEVSPDNRREPHRHLMEFGKTKRATENTLLGIHTGDHSDYTAEYKMLTRDFYLNI